MLLGRIAEESTADRTLVCDCLYFIALGQYKLKDYVTAQTTIQKLLQLRPNSRQAEALKQLIQRKLKFDGIVGLATAGAVALTGVAILALIAGSVAKK